MKNIAIKRRNNGFSGAVPQSTMRIRVAKNTADIRKMASKKGISNEKAAEMILRMSQDEIKKYIQSKGEVPVKTWEGRSLQAALLRMEDISVLSRSMDMTEDQALAHIEEAETDAVQNNTAAKSSIMTPSTQAALSYVISYIQKEMKDKVGVTGISNSLDQIRTVLSSPKNHNISASAVANNFDGSDSGDDIPDFVDPAADPSTISPASVTTSIQPIGVSGGSSITASGPTSGSMAPITSTSSDGSIWSNIGSLASAISNIGSTITGTANSLSSTINNVGGQIGANAISTYLSQNWAYIVAGIIAIAVIIIMLTRAAKS